MSNVEKKFFTKKFTHFKSASQNKYSASIFIILPCVTPDKAHILDKSFPALVIRHSCGLLPTMNAANTLLNAFERNGLLNQSIVVGELPRGQVQKGFRDYIATKNAPQTGRISRGGSRGHGPI